MKWTENIQVIYMYFYTKPQTQNNFKLKQYWAPSLQILRDLKTFYSFKLFFVLQVTMDQSNQDEMFTKGTK